MRPFLILLVLALSACANKGNNKATSSKDTTQVIELALKTVLTENFPQMEGIKRKSIFQDSIFFTTNLVPLSSLPPHIDSFHFKILPDSTICSVLKTDTVSAELPNYLRLQIFQKTDTGYFVQFESIECLPSASRQASVGLHILKTKDKFLFRPKAGSQ